MSKSPIKVAAAQCLITADVRANGREIRRLMVEARAAGAGLIHFPEAAMSGCSKAQVKDWGLVDWEAIADELRATAALARELELWVVVGSAHRLTAPNRPHNSLYVISDRGELVTRYDKRFCSHTEITGWHAPGRSPCVFEVGGWKFGCVLCIEVHFPELFLDYAERGVDCILFSAYADDPMFGVQAQGYAASHSFWISLSIPTQTSGALTSRLIGPTGEIQASAVASASGIAVETLDEDSPRWEVARHRARPWRARAREGGIYRPHDAVDDPRSQDRTAF
ncbi:carbon-nitrogen hydrolase family protein [Paludisphaera rhizosphaerae]|uniref:carbon-nitrogen hydrolase family protein n=1 Tax=Paludisphaera rhizosphaerae TaxID=2711216 RepID=UPI0013EA5639|nr:carbon-nitrogen hydrolase family protein [Paludisphaera rhizosphaerae]